MKSCLEKRAQERLKERPYKIRKLRRLRPKICSSRKKRQVARPMKMDRRRKVKRRKRTMRMTRLKERRKKERRKTENGKRVSIMMKRKAVSLLLIAKIVTALRFFLISLKMSVWIPKFFSSKGRASIHAFRNCHASANL